MEYLFSMLVKHSDLTVSRLDVAQSIGIINLSDKYALCFPPKKKVFQVATFLEGKKSSSPTIDSACLEVTTFKNPGEQDL